MSNVPASIGYITVNARGITAFADSDDVGNEPDARPMLGMVTFTPQVGRKPIVAIAESPKYFVAVNQIEAEMDTSGFLRPPGDGENPPIDDSGSLRLIAPDQPDSLSIFGWTWTATFRPFQGQSWESFSVVFSGAPGETIDLVDLYLVDQGVSGGGISPSARPVYPDDLERVAFTGDYEDMTGSLPISTIYGMSSLSNVVPGDVIVKDDYDNWTTAPLPKTSSDVGIVLDTSIGTKLTIDGVVVYYDSGWRATTEWDDQGNVTGNPLSEAVQPLSGEAGGIYFRRYLHKVWVRIVNLDKLSNTPSGYVSSSAQHRIQKGFRPTKRENIVVPSYRSTSEVWTLRVDKDGLMGRCVDGSPGAFGEMTIEGFYIPAPELPTVLPGNAVEDWP